MQPIFFNTYTKKKWLPKLKSNEWFLNFHLIPFYILQMNILLLKSDRKHTNYIQFPTQVHDTLVETHETGDAQIPNTSTCYK